MEYKLISKQIIKDIAEGMADTDLMKRYQLSRQQLREVFTHIARARKRRIVKIARDISSGMLCSDLRNKYGLSQDALTKALNSLLQEGMINQTDIEKLKNFSAIGFGRRERRSQMRIFPYPVVDLCEIKRFRTQYVLRDITERGLCVAGIEATPSEIIHFIVLGDETGEIWPFEMVAECRWAELSNDNADTCAGFRISKISEQDLARLHDLLKRYNFSMGTACTCGRPIEAA